MALPQTEIVLTFHLIGIDPEEAKRVQKVHGHIWETCGTRRCEQDAQAIVLARGPSGLPGDVQGFPLCAEHEGPFLHDLQQSQGYRGAAVSLEPAT